MVYIPFAQSPVPSPEWLYAPGPQKNLLCGGKYHHAHFYLYAQLAHTTNITCVLYMHVRSLSRLFTQSTEPSTVRPVQIPATCCFYPTAPCSNIDEVLDRFAWYGEHRCSQVLYGHMVIYIYISCMSCGSTVRKMCPLAWRWNECVLSGCN